jgi:hypothetical protein
LAVLTNRKRPPAHGFFITATLRGICEDLIVLTFLTRFAENDRNRAASLLALTQIAEGIGAQREFFTTARPWQPVLDTEPVDVAKAEAELRQMARERGWTGAKPWPSVWFMAKESSLVHVYRYFYSATSKWVHFSPHVLLRMGWGGRKEGKLGDETEWTFSTANFKQYYSEFNHVNSVYLLLLLLRGPGASLVPEKALSILTSIDDELHDILRWPEAVTFEEMNLRGPHPLTRMLLKATNDVIRE